VPKIKSAKKAMRQARSRTVRNKAQRSELRTAVKRVRAAATAATAAAATAAYAIAAKLLDRAARKGLIHKNNAARHKSRLAAMLKKLAAK
jgi:small subunit ribosomal protein S20